MLTRMLPLHFNEKKNILYFILGINKLLIAMQYISDVLITYLKHNAFVNSMTFLVSKNDSFKKTFKIPLNLVTFWGHI